MAQPPPLDLSPWIPVDQHDLIVIGTEECMNSIQKSLIFSSKAKWVRHLVAHLGPSYAQVTGVTLQAIHIIVFVRQTLANHVSEIGTGIVRTGIGDVVGNKGGVAVGFDLGRTSFLFINAHFQAGQDTVGPRNDDFAKINSKMKLRAGSNRPPLVCDRFARVFWLGDLNYRLEGGRSMVDSLLDLEMWEVLRANDQLLKEMQRNKVFQGFTEGVIEFAPTYKYDLGTDVYDSSLKKRVPAWTDRVLYKPAKSLKLLAYDAVRTIRTSDHRPVYAVFAAEVDGLPAHWAVAADAASANSFSSSVDKPPPYKSLNTSAHEIDSKQSRPSANEEAPPPYKSPPSTPASQSAAGNTAQPTASVKQIVSKKPIVASCTVS